MAERAKWAALLSSTRVSDLLGPQRKLIVAERRTSLGDVLERLQTHKLLSVPVVDGGAFLGFVDVLDIVGVVLARWRQQSWALERAHFPTQPLFDTAVVDVLNFSQYDTPAFIAHDATLSSLLALLTDAKYAFRLHRVAVVRDGRVVDVVSQSDVVRFVATHVDDVPPELRTRTLGSMSGLIRTPIMVRLDTMFVDALELLYKNRVSGLAIVDHEFKLSGNLSASDLRGMNSAAYDFFLGSTLQFLAKGTTSASHVTTALGTDATFGEAVRMLAAERVHRIYITDSLGHPLGVVSLIDVICRL